MINWIKITDQLPPEKIGILVSDGKIVTCAVMENYVNGLYFYTHESGGYEWEWDFDTNKITHWATLPSPPSE